MSIIESVKNFIQTCPYIKDLGKIMVDYLSEGKGDFSIEEVPTNTIVEEYVDGSSDRQFVFVIAARLHYSDELRTNIDNSGLFEKIEHWLEECTEEEKFPTMPDGMQAYKIEATSNGYLFGINGNLTNARYQIQCRLLYTKE